MCIKTTPVCVHFLPFFVISKPKYVYVFCLEALFRSEDTLRHVIFLRLPKYLVIYYTTRIAFCQEFSAKIYGLEYSNPYLNYFWFPLSILSSQDFFFSGLSLSGSSFSKILFAPLPVTPKKYEKNTVISEGSVIT